MPRIARQITAFTQQEIRRLLRAARTVCRYPGLDIKSAPTTGPIGRILIITPRKMGSAPERNMLRRRLKALYYQEKLYTRGKDLVIYGKQASVHIPFIQLKELITHALPSS